MQMLPLKCPVKYYHWGTKGSRSIVAQIASKWQDIDENGHYAELWMGTHPSGPAVVMGSTDDDFEGKPLTTILSNFPEYAGNMKMVSKFGRDLPFLFKVLSVGEPLSIQTHPDKALAKKLRATYPDVYPDDNHKPEMAIALSKFDALCSFRLHSEIQQNLRLFPEFKKVVGQEATDAYLSSSTDSDLKERLKTCFANLMNAQPELVATNLADLAKRLSSGKVAADLELVEVFRQINAIYPEDVGCFCLFFLNHITLNPGEALFLPANEPHAYLFGDCMECMAKSDNVIRAGLTPKFKDVPNLCSSLTYTNKSKEEVLLKPYSVNGCFTTFRTPAEEFAVDVIQVCDENCFGMPVDLQPRESGSILIVIKGEIKLGSKIIDEGSVLFIPAILRLPLLLIGNVLCYRAYVPSECNQQ